MLKSRNLKAKMSKPLGVLLAALLLLGTLTACGGQPEASGQPVNLSYGISNAWDSLMPYNTISGSNYARIVYDKLYDRLAYVQADGTCLPRAAKSWESADDGYAILFHLDENAKFHDGTPVTVQHWIETFQLMTDPNCPTLGRTAFAGLVGVDENGAQDPMIVGKTLGVGGVDATDLYTLKLSFTSPQSPEEFLIAKNREFYVLPTHLMQDVEPAEVMEMDLWKAPIGSGPMKFVSEIGGSTLTLETNRDYHLGAAGFDTMTMTVIDKSNQLTALIAGDLDYYAFGNTLGEEDVSIAEQADFTILRGEIPTTFYELMLNNESISTKELRQAIHLALDRDMLCLQNSGDLGQPTTSSLLPGSGYAPTDAITERDLTRAAALVDAQYSGTTLTLACTAPRASLAALIQQNLQEAGFAVEIMTVDSATLFAGMYDGAYDMAIASHTPNALPLWFVESRFRDDNNLFRVPDVAPYLTRIEAVANALDQAERLLLLAELETYLAEEMPFVPLWFVTPLYAESKTVSGIDYPASSFSNENVWEWAKQ